MKPGLAVGSLLLLGLSILLLVAWTNFESVLTGMSSGVERFITFLMLVLPATVGVILGILSLRRREGRAGMAITGIVLNGLFALFHLALVLFAG
jgi:hypothetical protein